MFQVGFQITSNVYNIWSQWDRGREPRFDSFILFAMEWHRPDRFVIITLQALWTDTNVSELIAISLKSIKISQLCLLHTSIRQYGLVWWQKPEVEARRSRVLSQPRLGQDPPQTTTTIWVDLYSNRLLHRTSYQWSFWDTCVYITWH